MITESVLQTLVNSKRVGDQCHTICTNACSKANEAVIRRFDDVENAMTTLIEGTHKLHDKVDELSDKIGKVLTTLGHSNSLPILQQAAQRNLGNPSFSPPSQSVTTPFFPQDTRSYQTFHQHSQQGQGAPSLYQYGV